MDENNEQVVLNRFERLAVGGALPIDRSGQRIFADDDYVYMIGGYNPFPERTLSDAWRFNRLTEEWQQCTLADPNNPLPDTLASFSLVSRGPPPDCNTGSNEAYIFGGTKVPFGGQSNTNRFYWLKIDKQGRVHLQLQSVSGTEPLPAMYGQGMCRRVEKNLQGRLRETIYIVGGTTGHEYNMDVWRLQRAVNALQTDSWDLVRLNRHNPDEIGRYRLELVPWQNRIFTFGGSISDQFFVGFEELTVFNLELNEFEKLKTKPGQRVWSDNSFPHARSCHAVIQRDNQVYLIGGRDMSMNVFPVVWRFNLDTLEWSEINTRLSVPVFFHSAAITPDACIFVFGGVAPEQPANPNNPPQTRRVNHLQRMWLEPPSLKYSACNEVLRTFPDEQRMQYTREGIRLTDVMVLINRALQPPAVNVGVEMNENPIPIWHTFLYFFFSFLVLAFLIVFPLTASATIAFAYFLFTLYWRSR